MGLEFALSAFAAIFAIINPVGALPIFEAVTQVYPPEIKRRIINKICMVTIITLFIFGLFGNWIFSIYGITIASFKVAGGILLFSVAYSMVNGQPPKSKISEQDTLELEGADDVGIVPLGVPLFAGPGAITTVMIFVSEAVKDGDVFDLTSVFISILITVAISYVLMRHSHRLIDMMGRSGAMAFSRIMGVLLAAVAISFISSGIIQLVRDAGFTP